MSQPQNGRRMDQTPAISESVRRARERAQAGMARGNAPVEDQNTGPWRNPQRPQAPQGRQAKERDGQFGVAISRPTQVPQWPLAGPIAPPTTTSEPYRPPPGRSQPPQRPPRPSKVPSILDGSRVQDPTPFFLTAQAAPNSRVSELSASDTMGTSSSRTSDLSSVGSIPDFPLPVATSPNTPTTAGPPRKSVNLGPPPSARRGASSFYSTASFVSPIPEESPRSRSYASIASSMAMPESYGEISPAPSSGNGAFFDDAIAEESMCSDDADESRLVRSASVGKRGKPALIDTKASEKAELESRPKDIQRGSFRGGTGYVEESSSASEKSSTAAAAAAGTALTADSMLSAVQAASATDPSSVRNGTSSPKPFRLSALRRPPRLDIDAVRDAEARGSLTSLPDLIRRATRLASMIDRGKRPTSQFNELDFPEAMFAKGRDRDTFMDEKYQSGLSDMLAAFPPPAATSRQSNRQSMNAWPLPFARRSYRGPGQLGDSPEGEEPRKQKRRCCGIPLWAFIILVIVILCIIAAAVVLPVFFLVLNKDDDNVAAQPVTEQCRDEITCANGGTTVITQGKCMCICSFGFTGPDCSVRSAQGCTTTTLNTPGSTVDDATVGQAIPRLLQSAQADFGIPLSATEVTSKFNDANLSCTTQNALVTFDDPAVRVEAGLVNAALDPDLAEAAVTTVLPDSDITLTIDNPAITSGIDLVVSTFTSLPTFPASLSTVLDTTIKSRAPDKATEYPVVEPPSSTTSAPPSTTSSSRPTPTFTVNSRVLDFARIAVLFIFQEETLDDASTAQSSLSRFFTDFNSDNGTSTQTESPANLTIGADNTIDLVNLSLDLGGSRIGGDLSS